MRRYLMVKLFVIFLFSSFIGAGVSSDTLVETPVEVESDNGLIAHWSFDEGSGDVVHDSSGYHNDGLISGANWVEGKYSYALEFRDTDIVYEIPASFDDPNNLDIAIDCWIYWYGANSFSRGSYIFDARDLEGNHGGFYFYIKPDGVVEFQVMNLRGYGQKVASNSRIETNKWVHLTAMLDYTHSRTLKLFIDGVEDATEPATDPYYDFGGSHWDAAIGNNRYAPGDSEWAPFNGIIDEIYIYGKSFLPPNKPSRPSGPTNGKIWVSYSYSSSTTDPNNARLYYIFDWDDGTNSGWIGPYESNQTVTLSHIWKLPGSYQVKVKARNEYGLESVWSDPLPVSMPKNFGFIKNLILELWRGTVIWNRLSYIT